MPICFIQEEDETNKDSGRKRSTSDATALKVDPKKKAKASLAAGGGDDLMYPIYTAKFDYEATLLSELSFRRGDQIHIKSKGDGKTWHASLNGKEGSVPKSYVIALDDEE